MELIAFLSKEKRESTPNIYFYLPLAYVHNFLYIYLLFTIAYKTTAYDEKLCLFLGLFGQNQRGHVTTRFTSKHLLLLRQTPSIFAPE
jgi:type II secretory pathway component PulF